ncbi:hypothetical protein [Mycobacterium sp. 94-17]|uniref:hypothetical protein n=1 Tax=Mycobacterium sp. 94-17 TaxID=2986147 RepID=UPI002D1ECEE3|nr:hypothetical protein [Mycobacterium sp. 94-17]MEB4208928.1 hypothetical protein [Mycobacterium sp. 94-17]
MLLTPTGVRTASDTADEPIAQPSSAAPAIEAPSLGSRIAAALRRMVADANQPRRPHYLRHYAYLEDARLAHEMSML